MSIDQLTSFNKIKTKIVRKYGLDIWQLICADDSLGQETLFEQMTNLYGLKINVLDTFGESTWKFLLWDELFPNDPNRDLSSPTR